MLEPQSRAALTEQLKPPIGFELSHAVGTTFTLDLATALAVPLSFASHRLSVQDDTLGVLDAIRRAADRVDVFAQAGEISMGARSDLVAFLEPMVHPVALRRGLFHRRSGFWSTAPASAPPTDFSARAGISRPTTVGTSSSASMGSPPRPERSAKPPR